MPLQSYLTNIIKSGIFKRGLALAPTLLIRVAKEANRDYSKVPNKRTGPNKHTGGIFCQNK